ncbi:hypothetical protein U3A55_09450 [Salarchaeum sp. III]
MSQRDTTIALSDDEKHRLDEAARELCGTIEVPYGEVVKLLTADVVDGDGCRPEVST